MGFFGFLKRTLTEKADPQLSVQPEKLMTPAKRVVSYHRKFNLRGVKFECKKDPDMHRQEAMSALSFNLAKAKIHLERYMYKKEPAYMVVLDKNNLDIGVVPAELVDTIEKYRGREYSVEIVDLYDIEGRRESDDWIGVEVLFRVYKECDGEDEFARL